MRPNINKNRRDDSDVPSITDSCKDKPFKCPKCESLLAFVDKETSSVIRVKYKDLYLYATDPAEFSILCRSCGNIATLSRLPS